MKKIISGIKKNDKYIVLVFIFLMITGIVLNLDIVSSDEMWNFQNIIKMVNGYQIYQDANVIITPMFYFIGFFLFQLLGANLFIFRCYHIIILTLVFFTTYLIARKLRIGRVLSYLLICFFILQSDFLLIKVSANYNLLALWFSLVGILLLLGDKENAIIQGIMAFLVFFSKQNMGIFYVIGFGIYQLCSGKKKKEKIKDIFLFSFTVLILGTIFMVYMQKIKMWDGFINFAFSGLVEFSQENISVNINILVQNVILLISYFILFYIVRKKYRKRALFFSNNKSNFICHSFYFNSNTNS